MNLEKQKELDTATDILLSELRVVDYKRAKMIFDKAVYEGQDAAADAIILLASLSQA